MYENQFNAAVKRSSLSVPVSFVLRPWKDHSDISVSRALRHLVCHFSNDGGAKRLGGEEEMRDLRGKRRRRKRGRRGGRGCLYCLRCVLFCVKVRIDLHPLFLFFGFILLCVFFSASASLYFSIPQFIPLPLLLWGPIWLKWNLFLIFFLIKI